MSKDDWKLEKKKILKEMIIFSQISILVPLILFGGLGFWLFKIYNKVYLLFIFLFLSFLITSFLLLRKTKFFSEKLNDKFKN